MNILFVIPYYIPAYSYGGPIKIAHDLGKEFVKKRHQVTVVTTDVHDTFSRNFIKKEKIDGVQVLRFQNLSNRLAKNYNAYFPLGFRFWIKKNLKNYDIVHCHDFFTYQNIIISKFCKKHNIPYIIHPHGCLDQIKLEAKCSNLKKFFFKYFSSVLNNASKIIVLTQNEEKTIHKLVKEKNKIVKIPNGVALNGYSQIKKINPYKKYNIPTTHKIIVFLGRLQYIKGLDISLKALEQIKKKLSFTFIIIGPDEGEKEKLEKQIKKTNLEKNVIFTGILQGKEKIATLKSADLFLFNSRSEGFGITIIEACATKVPVLISKNCPIPEVEKFKAGIITPNSTKEISKNLLKILSNNTLLKIFKKNTIKVCNAYAFEPYAKKILELYSQSLSKIYK